MLKMPKNKKHRVTTEPEEHHSTTRGQRECSLVRSKSSKTAVLLSSPLNAEILMFIYVIYIWDLPFTPLCKIAWHYSTHCWALESGHSSLIIRNINMMMFALLQRKSSYLIIWWCSLYLLLFFPVHTFVWEGDMQLNLSRRRLQEHRGVFPGYNMNLIFL